LTEEDWEKIGDQVKEVTDDAFQHVTHQEEEMHIQMQEQMVELRQLLEATNIVSAPQTKDEHTTSTTNNGEARPTNS
jgi:hypothetical protein